MNSHGVCLYTADTSSKFEKRNQTTISLIIFHEIICVTIFVCGLVQEFGYSMSKITDKTISEQLLLVQLLFLCKKKTFTLYYSFCLFVCLILRLYNIYKGS